MVLADIFARYEALKGRPVLTSTGTDEHGQKVFQAATKAGSSPMDWCTTNSGKFKNLAAELGVGNRFIRTTDPRHIECVQKIWQTLQDAGWIYTKTHTGWYSVRDECFHPEDMVTRAVDPYTGRPEYYANDSIVQKVEEKNYFFRLSRLKDRLLKFYEENPRWVQPPSRFSEVKTWVEGNLQDLSISRPKSRIPWGIPVPNDPDQTIYVWIDALMNYITTLGYPTNWSEPALRGAWPADVQVIGKDISRFHCVYWPAILMALDLPLPKQILCHAHWTLGHKKMSKSLGNGVDPFQSIDRFTVDTVRWYLAKKGAIQDDSSWDNAELAQTYLKDMVGTYGNLLARSLGSRKWIPADAVRMWAGKLVRPQEDPVGLLVLGRNVEDHFKNLRPDLALKTIIAKMVDVCFLSRSLFLCPLP